MIRTSHRLGIVAAVLALAASPALAAGPRDTQPSTIALTSPARVVAPGAWPALGESVSFTVTYPKQFDKYGVRVQVICYQSGALVYGEAGPYSQSFLLGGGSSKWLEIGGAADCVADLYYWSYNGGQKFNWLASTAFSAAQ